MSEELQKQLAAFLATLLDTVKSGGDWAAGQMPLLVQEKIAYGRIVETMWVGFYLVAALGALWGVPKLIRLAIRCIENAEKAAYDEEGKWVVSAFGSGLAAIVLTGFGIVSLLSIPTQVSTAIQVWFAPRLYIIEWLRGML